MNDDKNKPLAFDIQADVLPQLSMKIGQLECNNAMIQAANIKLNERVAQLEHENAILKSQISKNK